MLSNLGTMIIFYTLFWLMQALGIQISKYTCWQNNHTHKINICKNLNDLIETDLIVWSLVVLLLLRQGQTLWPTMTWNSLCKPSMPKSRANPLSSSTYVQDYKLYYLPGYYWFCVYIYVYMFVCMDSIIVPFSISLQLFLFPHWPWSRF